MILRSSPASPYGRKCKISLLVLGLTGQIEIIKANTLDPADTMRQQNPLGKIPILITNEGMELFDSPVICEYLDSAAGGGKLFPTGNARWPALKLQALGDGILDSALLQVYERRYRSEELVHQPWLDMQQEKIDGALTWLEANTPDVSDQPAIGEITIACALGYLDFRHGGKWRDAHPGLVAWLDDFARAVPAHGQTIPSD